MRYTEYMDKLIHPHAIGVLGESVAERYMIRKGHRILDRNYRQKWGEIDVISQKKKRVHFIEVKTVSEVLLGNGEVRGADAYRPEDNIHPRKLERLHRAIQSYLYERKIDYDWQIDVVTVRLDIRNRRAKVVYLDNVILS